MTCSRRRRFADRKERLRVRSNEWPLSSYARRCNCVEVENRTQAYYEESKSRATLKCSRVARCPRKRTERKGGEGMKCVH